VEPDILAAAVRDATLRRRTMSKLSKSKTGKGPAEWFSGDVWIESIGQAQGSSPLGAAAGEVRPSSGQWR
jgi:hypothetical protein